MKFYPTITSITGKWREKIKEANEMEIKEVCFFPTMLSLRERKEAYELLLSSNIKRIPFVHIRNDMELEEIEFLIKNFGTERFNIHSHDEFPLIKDYRKYKDLIYVENVYKGLDEEEVKKWAGICLDFSHLENDRILDNEKFEENFKVLKRNKIGCNHISAVCDTFYINQDGFERYDNHMGSELKNFDYVLKYPKEFFSDFCAMELENDLAFQLEAINYINERQN